MDKVTYEYQVTTDHGEDIWYWGLDEFNKVIKDIKEYKNEDGFYVELIKCKRIDDDIFGWGSDKDYFDVYPDNDNKDLPTYVQNNIAKVLKGVQQ